MPCQHNLCAFGVGDVAECIDRLCTASRGGHCVRVCLFECLSVCFCVPVFVPCQCVCVFMSISVCWCVHVFCFMGFCRCIIQTDGHKAAQPFADNL